MRKLLLFTVLLWCLPSWAAVTLVQVHTGAFAANSGTATAAFTNNAAGNLGVIAVQWCSATGNAVLITGAADTSGNTYSLIPASKASIAATHYADCNTEFLQATLLTFTGTNTVTVSFATANASVSIGIWELTPGVLDQEITGTNTNTNVPTPGSITTGSAGSFYIAAGILDNGFGFGSGWFTAGGSFTLNTENGGGNQNSANEYFAQTSAGALAGTFGTNFSGTTGPNAGSMVTFKPASAPPAAKIGGPVTIGGPGNIQ